MRDNINKVSERGARLDSLQDKTDNLAVSAQGFRRGANRVRKQMWWKDMKMRMCLIVGIIILLVVIIVPSGECDSNEVDTRSKLTTYSRCNTEVNVLRQIPQSYHIIMRSGGQLHSHEDRRVVHTCAVLYDTL